MSIIDNQNWKLKPGMNAYTIGILCLLQQLERSVLLYRKESMARNRAAGNSILQHSINIKILRWKRYSLSWCYQLQLDCKDYIRVELLIQIQAERYCYSIRWLVSVGIYHKLLALNSFILNNQLGCQSTKVPQPVPLRQEWVSRKRRAKCYEGPVSGLRPRSNPCDRLQGSRLWVLTS